MATEGEGPTARRASMAQRTLGLESQGRKYRKGEQKHIGVLADETGWRCQRHGLLVGRFAVSDETRPRPPHEPLLDFSVRIADLGAAPRQTSSSPGRLDHRAPERALELSLSGACPNGIPASI